LKATKEEVDNFYKKDEKKKKRIVLACQGQKRNKNSTT